MTKDPEVMRYIGLGTPWTKDQTKDRLQRFIDWYQLGLGLYIALDKRSNKMIGHSGLVPQTIEERIWAEYIEQEEISFNYPTWKYWIQKSGREKWDEV